MTGDKIIIAVVFGGLLLFSVGCFLLFRRAARGPAVKVVVTDRTDYSRRNMSADERRAAIAALPDKVRHTAEQLPGETEADAIERMLIAIQIKHPLRSHSREDHPILRQILNVRHRAAANFSDEFKGARGEAYDNAVLDCYREVEAFLTGEDKRDRYGRTEKTA